MTNIEQRLNKLEKKINCTSCETQFYDALADFPEEGVENRLYIDKTGNAIYIWNPQDEQYQTLGT